MINLIRSIPNHESMTAAEIAQAIRAIGLTNRPIAIPDLLFLLRSRGMLVKQVGPSGWLGSVVRMVELLPDAQKLPVQIWLSHITDPNSRRWDTTAPEFAQPFYELYQAFADSPIFRPGDFDAIYELGGGLRYESLTAAEVESAFAQAALAESARQIHAAKQALKARLERITTEIKSRIDVGNITSVDGFAAVIDEVP